MHIKLDDKVSENFKKIFYWIVECAHYMFVLKGGRYSSKSVTAGEAVVAGVMKYKKSAIMLMQYKADLSSKIVDNITFCINNLGVQDCWKLKKSPYEYVLLDSNEKETNVSIRFYGCDNVQDTKGMKSRTGEGFKYIWFEEVNRFKNWEVVQSIIDTCDRLTDTKACVIMTYNPPKDGHNWVNERFNAPVGKALGYKTDLGIMTFEFKKNGIVKEKNTVIHHSTMEDLIENGHDEWVADGIYGSAMESKENNPSFYRWNYLGDIVGSQAAVFDNICDWTYNEDYENKTTCDYHGIDASNGGSDPWRYIEVAYDSANKDLYILKEFNVVGRNSEVDVKFDNVAYKFKEVNKNNILTYGDGAVPDNVNALKNRGCNVVLVHKDRKVRGVMWLQSLNHIYIDRDRTPYAYQEFISYEYKLDKQDELTNDLKDGNDHSIDACRYALVNVIKWN